MGKKETLLEEKPAFNPRDLFNRTSDTETKEQEFNPRTLFKETVANEQFATGVGTPTQIKGYVNQDALLDILKPVDASEAEKQHIIYMARKGAPQNEVSDAILTIQGKHPKQEGGYKYYLEDTGKGYEKPVPIKDAEKAPKGQEINSIWGTQGEAEDDTRTQDIAKKIYNVLPSIAGSVNDLAQVVYGSATGEELPWYRAIKNSEQYLKFKTSSDYNKGIINTDKIHNFSDLLEADSYDFSPSTIANTATQVGQSVLQFIATRGALGTAGKGANKLLRAGEITKEAADKAIKMESYAKGFASSYMVNLGQAMQAANDLGVTGRDAYLTALAVTVPIAAIDMVGGGEGAINKAFQEETGKNLVENLVKGAIKDSEGKFTDESLNELYKTAYSAAATVAEKSKGKFFKTVVGESGQEVSQNVLDKTSQLIHDNLVSDEKSKYGTEPFSPQSVAEYLNDAFGGLIGGAQGHVLSKPLKQKKQDEDKSKTIMSVLSSGNVNELKTQLIAAQKSGEITKEDLDRGLFNIEKFEEYQQATKDRRLDDDSKRKIFKLTYEKANVKEGIENLEKNNVDGINDGEIDLKKQHVKEIESRVEEIWKGAEEKAKKPEEPITSAVKNFKFKSNEKDFEKRKIYEHDENMTDEEFMKAHPETRFLYAYDKALGFQERGFSGLAGKLEIPQDRAASIRIGNHTLELATSDLEKKVNGENINGILKDFDGKTVHLKGEENNGWKVLNIYDQGGYPIRNKEGQQYTIRSTEQGHGIKLYHTSEHKVADFDHNGLHQNSGFATWKSGLEGQNETPEVKEQIAESIKNPHKENTYGEKYIDFANKVINTYKKQLSNSKDKTLVVTHSQVMKLIDQWEKQGRPEDLNELDFNAIADEKYGNEEIHQYPSAKGSIVLVRHGDTTQNESVEGTPNRVRTWGVELAPEGIKTAENLGNKLKGFGISEVVTSNQPRAEQTARIIKDIIHGQGGKETKTKPTTVKPTGGNVAEEIKITKTVRKESVEKETKQDKDVAEKVSKLKEERTKELTDAEANPNITPSDRTNLIKNINERFDENIKNVTNLAHGKEENTTKREKFETRNTESVLSEGDKSSEGKKGERIYVGNTKAKGLRKIKSPLHLKALDTEVFTPFDLALQYFIRKGNVSPETIKDIYEKKGGYVFQELQTRISLLKKGAPTAEQIGELLSVENENLNFDEQDYRNAIEEVLQQFNSRTQMAQDLVDRYVNEKVDYSQSEEIINEQIVEAEKESVDEILDNALGKAESLTDEKIEDIATKDKAFDDFVDNGEDIFTSDEPIDFQKHVFDEFANQIKLADGTNKTFSPNTKDIRYQKEKDQKRSEQFENSKLEAVTKITNLLKSRNPKLKIVYDKNLKAAGAAQGNAIKINPFYAGTDTPIHEVAHILIDSIGGLDNKVIAKAVNELKGTKLWSETEVRYPELSPEGLAKEVLAEAIGREGANIFDNEAANSKFKTYLDYIFHRIKSLFGLERNNVKALAKRVIAGDVYNQKNKTFESQTQKPKIVKSYFPLINKILSQLDKNKIKEIVYNINEINKEFGDISAAHDMLDLIIGTSLKGNSSYKKIDINGKILTLRVSDHVGYDPAVYINYPDQASIPKTDYMIDIILDKKNRFDGEDDFYAQENKFTRMFFSVPKFEDNIDAEIFIDDVLRELNDEIKDIYVNEQIQFQKLKEEKPQSKYRDNTDKISKEINDAKELDKFSTDQLIDIYNRFITDKEYKSKKELKEAGKRIAYVLFRNRKEELNKEFGDKFVENEANKSDLGWKDIRFKVLSHMTEKFPELQELSKIYDEATFNMQTERHQKKTKLEKLGTAVIKEKNKELGIIGKLQNYFSNDNAKYFNYLDKYGKLLTLSEAKDKGLSNAQIEYLKYFRELVAERKELEANEDVYNKELEILKTNKDFREAFNSESVVSAVNTYLGKGFGIHDVRISYGNPNTGKTEIASLGEIEKQFEEYGKKSRFKQASAILQMIKYNFKARKQYAKGVNADENINPLDTFKTGNYQINPKGELTSKFDRAPEGDNYSKDFYRAALEFVDDTTHIKHMGKILPIVNAIDYLNREGYGEHINKPNVVEWLNDWRKLHIFKEKLTTNPYLDQALKTLRYFTSAISFMFNVPAAGMNLAMGVYNNWRSETTKQSFIGHKRLFGDLGKHKKQAEYGFGLLNPYAIDILIKYHVVSYDFDSNPKMFAGKLFDMLAYGATRFGEYDIQGSLFLGLMRHKDYNSFEYNDKGELVVKKGIDEKALAKKLLSYQNRVSDIQGKYSDKDKRNIQRGELGKTVFQFKTWMPDYWKERFGEEYITRDNKVHKGSWRVLVGDARKDLIKDIKAKGFKAIWNNKEAMANLKGAMSVAFLMVLKYQDDDDKDKRRKALSLDNALGNVLFIFDPNQLKFTLQQPVASIGTLTKFANILGDVMKLDAVDSKKLQKDVVKVLPYRKVITGTQELIGE